MGKHRWQAQSMAPHTARRAKRPRGLGKQHTAAAPKKHATEGEPVPPLANHRWLDQRAAARSHGHRLPRAQSPRRRPQQPGAHHDPAACPRASEPLCPVRQVPEAHLLQVRQAGLEHTPLEPVRGDLQRQGAAVRRLPHRDGQTERRLSLLKPNVRRVAAALALVPCVRVTSVFPTFRSVNMDGAFTSYQYFFVKGSTLRERRRGHGSEPAPDAPARTGPVPAASSAAAQPESIKRCGWIAVGERSPPGSGLDGRDRCRPAPGLVHQRRLPHLFGRLTSSSSHPSFPWRGACSCRQPS